MNGLTELLENPGKADGLKPEAIPVLLARLASLQSVLTARLLEDVQSESATAKDGAGDRLLGIADAASKLHVTRDWLYRRGGKLPFAVHMGRNLRFSEKGIEKYIRQRVGR